MCSSAALEPSQPGVEHCPPQVWSSLPPRMLRRRMRGGSHHHLREGRSGMLCLWRRWEAAWDPRCQLPHHCYHCQAGVREGPFLWGGLYFSMKFPNSKRRGGRESHFPMCIPYLWHVTGMIIGKWGYPTNHLTGEEAPAFYFPPLPLISPIS